MSFDRERIEGFKGLKPKLIAIYEKLYDKNKTLQMYLLSHKDDKYARKHSMKIMTLEDTLEYIIKLCQIK